MRKSFVIATALVLGLAGAGPARAGTLTAASLQVTVLGATATFTASSSAAGSSTATTATLGAGSAFRGTVTSAGGPFLFSTVHVFLYDNGALAATSGGAVSITAPITGGAYFGKLSSPLLAVPISAAGSPGSQTYFQDPRVTVRGSDWHVGQVATTGLFTSFGSPQANGTVLSTTPSGKKRIRVQTTGSFNLTANGAGSVKLVTLNHVIVSGSASADTITPTVLTLTYAAPEPGTLPLLGAGIAGMVAAGRRRRLA